MRAENKPAGLEHAIVESFRNRLISQNTFLESLGSARSVPVKRYEGNPSDVYIDGDLRFDRATFEVKVGDKYARLNPVHGRLFTVFTQNAGHILPRLWLTAAVWGENGITDTGVRVTVSQLKSALRSVSAGHSVGEIHSIRGIGYTYTPVDSEENSASQS